MLGRHYTDLVLIAVVALCTLENDVIHAGYLALALLFFRRRDALRNERNRLCPSLATHTVTPEINFWASLTCIHDSRSVREPSSCRLDSTS